MAKRPSTKRKSTRRRAPRPDSNVRIAAWALGLVVAGLIALLIGWGRDCSRTSATAVPEGDLTYVSTAPGLPEQLVNYRAMTISFNPDTHQPNWVAWELTADHADGPLSRKSDFEADPDVDGCASPADYRNSGFDRGHMAPAGDMKWDAQAMNESFLMTNICPQVGELNRGAWKKLEEKCRNKALADSVIYVVCGPIFDATEPSTIGQTQVAVPSRFFKVVLSPYADPPQAIGFVMPNGYVRGGMQACAVSVDEVEALTGHDFFSALPDDLEESLESQCNFHRWSAKR